MIHKPFFSFLLITYNQERFVADAFASILKQTDRDFEIIICDDNSKDSTFAVCQELVESYRKSGGDIHIVLHKNDVNKGIGGNFQQAYELSHGQWLLMAAGDDISLPTRLQTIRKVIASHPNAYAVNTGRYFVDEEGNNPKYNFAKGYLLGADSVWHRDVFAKFRSLDKTVMSEDHILNLRAMLLGEMVQVNTPTINYRVSSLNYSIQKTSNILEAKKAALKKMTYTKKVLEFRIKDLEQWEVLHKCHLMPMVLEKNYRELADTSSKMASYELYIDVLQSNFLEKMKYVLMPCRIWLHSNVLYRMYNVLKMYSVLSDKPKRKVNDINVALSPDGSIISLKLANFLEDCIF